MFCKLNRESTASQQGERHALPLPREGVCRREGRSRRRRPSRRSLGQCNNSCSSVRGEHGGGGEGVDPIFEGARNDDFPVVASDDLFFLSSSSSSSSSSSDLDLLFLFSSSSAKDLLPRQVPLRLGRPLHGRRLPRGLLPAGGPRGARQGQRPRGLGADGGAAVADDLPDAALGRLGRPQGGRQGPGPGRAHLGDQPPRAALPGVRSLRALLPRALLAGPAEGRRGPVHRGQRPARRRAVHRDGPGLVAAGGRQRGVHRHPGRGQRPADAGAVHADRVAAAREGGDRGRRAPPPTRS